MIILESFITGPTVEKMLSSGQSIDCFKLVVDIISALSTLENIGILHFDLIDSNVIYDVQYNNYVLIDFNDVFDINPFDPKEKEKKGLKN